MKTAFKWLISATNGEASAQSQAKPTQMSEGWIGIVGDFFNNRNMSPQDVQKRLHDLLIRAECEILIGLVFGATEVGKSQTCRRRR
jgi:hypothetical protein